MMPSPTAESPTREPRVDGSFGDRSTRERLRALGLSIDFVPADVAKNAAQAAELVARYRDHAVLKVDSDEVLHKSEHGLVRLGVNAATVHAEYKDLVAAAAAIGAVDGVSVVQPMADPGLDLFIGVAKDEALGHVVMVGLGGVTVELFKDVARALAPVDADQARQMLESLNSFPLITGWRGSAAHSTEQLEQLLIQISEFAASHPELEELDLNPIRLYPDGSYLVLDARSSWSRPAASSSTQTTKRDLTPLFSPSSIAVVGASRDPQRPGGKLMRALVAGGFAGPIYPINPRGGEIEAKPVYPNLSELPAVPDLVCVAVSADAAGPVVEECARLGVPAVLLLASGYSEIGEAGTERERALRASVEGTSTVLCGPNTIGLVNPNSNLLATFSQGMTAMPARDSGVCVIAQSGAVAGSLVSRELAKGYGIGSWVTVGNQVGLDVADYIDHYVDQDDTRSIALFLEGVRDGKRLREALARAQAKDVPVAAFKTGLTEVGSRAVSAHSGALAGSGEAYKALLRQEGVAQVTELTALLETAWVLAHLEAGGSNGVAVLTTSGGAGSAVIDLVSDAGMTVATLAPYTEKALGAALPSMAHVANPLDVTAEGAFIPGTFQQTISELQRDPSVGVVLATLTSISGQDAVRVAQEIADAANNNTTPVLVTWLVDPSLAREGLEILSAAGVRVFDEPARMVAAAGHLFARASRSTR